MPTHYKGPEKEINALNLYIKLMRAAHSISSRIHSYLIKRKVTVSQFWILDALYYLGPLSHQQLAKKTLMSPGNITTIVNNLEKRALVKQTRSTQDRRFVKVQLTEDGARFFAQVFPLHVKRITEEMSILTDLEQLEFARLCKKLGLRTNDYHPD
mgnify:CR=1 FL=1